MKNFADRLSEKIHIFHNPTVLGLDPKLDYVPEFIQAKSRSENSDAQIASAAAILEFNRRLIDITCDIIPAIKVQFAYYEMYGVHGIETLKNTIAYAHGKEMIVIADAKRNDIGATAQAYANGIIGCTSLIDGSEIAMLDADAITLNAYLGIDGIEPFIKTAREAGKGLFILVRTSNSSAGDFQDLRLKDGRYVYEAVADKVAEWGMPLIGDRNLSSVGAVVGATWPEQSKTIRKRMPHSFILIPGYGVQGGDADSAVCAFTDHGDGAIVNASRSLMCAYRKRNDLNEEEFATATRDEAIRMREDLNAALERKLNQK
ncbi:MAG: orotidine-5'-phosphate decarboxylase [Clostridiales bacterium]|nr:orotidine-5'-phosphate decarboxylase [Clostridiales bacterium]